MMAGVVTASYIERHAGERLRRADVRDSFSMSVLVAAAEAELHMEVSYAAMNEWLTTYRMSAKVEVVADGMCLEERFGDELRRLAYASTWHLCRGLRSRTPAVYITESVAKQWFREYAGVITKRTLNSVQLLEQEYGRSLRALSDVRSMDAEGLRTWLRVERYTDASMEVCQSWLEGKYHELKYVDVEELERQCGIRLRFEQYASYFDSLTALGDLAERLADGQPAVWVRPEVLRDWHAKCHPTSIGIELSCAEELEAKYGE